jgi:hypothetical protein
VAVGVAGTTLNLLGVAAPAAARRANQLLRRIGAVAATALTALLATVGWVVLVFPLWAFSRVVGLSPLDSGWARAGHAWVTTPRGPGSELRAMSIASSELPVAPSIRRRRLVRTAVIASAICVIVVSTSAGEQAGPPDPVAEHRPSSHPPGPLMIAGLPVTEYAHEHEPWFREYAREVTTLHYRWQFFAGTSLTDARGRYLNIRDGHRITFQPRNPEITVWYFGGSTMFGIGQRDDETIPSQVAHLALADGVRIRSINFGVPSFVNWQETQVFEEALTAGPPPDLAVFYDGVNEDGLAYERVERGDTDPNVVARQFTSSAERRLYSVNRTFQPVPDDQQAELHVTLAARQYRRGVELARHLGDSYGVPVLHFWQPEFYAKRPSKADAALVERLGLSSAFVERARRDYKEISVRSGVDPIDLSGALDQTDVPVFFDGGHTNELGAATIAAAMYAHLKPTLERLVHHEAPASGAEGG